MIYSKNSRPLLGIKKFDLEKEQKSGWFRLGIDVNLCDIPDNIDFMLRCEYKYKDSDSKQHTTIIDYLCSKLKNNVYESTQGADLEETDDFKFLEIKII